MLLGIGRRIGVLVAEVLVAEVRWAVGCRRGMQTVLWVLRLNCVQIQQWRCLGVGVEIWCGSGCVCVGDGAGRGQRMWCLR